MGYRFSALLEKYMFRSSEPPFLLAHSSYMSPGVSIMGSLLLVLWWEAAEQYVSLTKLRLILKMRSQSYVFMAVWCMAYDAWPHQEC